MIKSNRESGFGRFDLVLIPRENKNVAIIMEFKKADNINELSIKAKEALNQIKIREYDIDILDLGIKKIYNYGISFFKKEFCILKEEN